VKPVGQRYAGIRKAFSTIVEGRRAIV